MVSNGNNAVPILGSVGGGPVVEASWTHRRWRAWEIARDHVTVSRTNPFLIRSQNVIGYMTDTDEIKDTETFQAVLDADRDDIRDFHRKHGEDKLADALEVTIDYLNGELTRRMAATDLGVTNYEGINITNEIEEVVREMHRKDPWLDTQLRDDVFE